MYWWLQKAKEAAGLQRAKGGVKIRVHCSAFPPPPRWTSSEFWVAALVLIASIAVGLVLGPLLSAVLGPEGLSLVHVKGGVTFKVVRYAGLGACLLCGLIAFGIERAFRLFRGRREGGR